MSTEQSVEPETSTTSTYPALEFFVKRVGELESLHERADSSFTRRMAEIHAKVEREVQNTYQGKPATPENIAKVDFMIRARYATYLDYPVSDISTRNLVVRSGGRVISWDGANISQERAC